MGFDDDEPVFTRSQWGTNRYVYNPRNPVGLALIVLTLAFAAVVLLLMFGHVGPFARPEPPTPAPSAPSSDMSRWLPPVTRTPPSGAGRSSEAR